MKNYLIGFLTLIFSFIFIACPQSDDDILIVPGLKIRILNNGGDLINTLTVVASDQTITLDQFEVNDLRGYYIISNNNINNNLLVTFQDANSTSVTIPVFIDSYGNYTLKVSASSNLSSTNVELIQDN